MGATFVRAVGARKKRGKRRRRRLFYMATPDDDGLDREGGGGRRRRNNRLGYPTYVVGVGVDPHNKKRGEIGSGGGKVAAPTYLAAHTSEKCTLLHHTRTKSSSHRSSAQVCECIIVAYKQYTEPGTPPNTTLCLLSQELS